MSLADTIARVRSGVLHITFGTLRHTKGSGSAFLSNGWLITNNHVFAGPVGPFVYVWHHPDPLGSPIPLGKYPLDVWRAALVSGSDEDHFDYAILDLPGLRGRGLHDFTLKWPPDERIGDTVAFLGFPLDHENLVCHSGAISSIYQSERTTVLQLDASVNTSNSGGPVFSVKSGEAIGIVTRKATGLSRAMDRFLDNLDGNIRHLDELKERFKGAYIRTAGVDPGEVARVGQYQMRDLAKEIFRSANVGIGYAFAASHVLADMAYTERP